MIKVEIVTDSINPNGERITTWVLTYPRFIHAEFMTHRSFSRNAASSRAIPIETMIKNIESCPAEPEFWGKNKKGMQASEQLDGLDMYEAKKLWRAGCKKAIQLSRNLLAESVHKQIANRVTEPWMHITVLATATEHDNFFSLRAHPDAQPEFQVLAYRMLDLYLKHDPRLEDWGHWHIPFGDRMPAGCSEDERLKIATARAARLSYLTFEGQIDVAKDCELHDRLMESGHWSPFEHCAYASNKYLDSGNFRGWVPYRKRFVNENRVNVDLKKIMASKPDWIQINCDVIDK